MARVWTPPETWADVTNDVANAILDEIEKGLLDGRKYSAAGAAKELAAWKVVLRHYPDKPPAQCREIIKAWLDSGVLYEEEYKNPMSREPAQGLRVNDENRPSRFAQ